MLFRILFTCSFLGIAALPNSSAALLSGPKDLGNIWFIGDSITQGGSDEDNRNSPRTALYELLTEANYSFSYTGHVSDTPDNLPAIGSGLGNLYQYHSSVSGAVIGDSSANGIHNDFTNPTNGQVLPGIAGNLAEWFRSGTSRLSVAKPDIILIMIGTNDVPYNDMAHAPDRLRNLIETIYALEGIGNPTIFLANITPNPQPINHANIQTPFDEKDQFVTQFNAAIPGLVTDFQTLGKDIHFVDQYTDIKGDTLNLMQPNDSLHLNSAGDDVVAQNWFEAIDEWKLNAVPEPATWGLIIVGAIMTLLVRRSRLAAIAK